MKKMSHYKGFFGILALAAVLIFGLVGCGEPGGGPPSGPVYYTVTFDANGGTVSPTSVEVERGKTVGSSLPKPTKTTGNTYFWGWLTKDGTGGDWGSLFTAATPVTASRTVYALWGKTSGITHNITFNATGGSVTPSLKQLSSVSAAGTLPTPTRPNYTFGGWYTAPNGGGTAFTSATVVTGHITVYAKWTIIEQPVDRSEDGQLTEAKWRAILTEINSGGEYVNLDLSACTLSDADAGGGLRSDGTFDPIYNLSTGKNRIVSLILPDDATSIVAGSSSSTPTFQGFSSLTIISASTVTTIGDYAFRGCTSLSSVSLPTVVTIGESAFYGCTSLSSVSLSAVVTIGESAFYGCTSLSSVSLPAVVTIGQSAFSGCTILASVSFPQVTTIGWYAFSRCTSLSSASFPQAATIGGDAFNGCTILASASFPAAATIYDSAFENCTSLSSASFPVVTTIGWYAFQGCTSLSSASFPQAITIGDGAFRGCTSLASVSFQTTTTIDVWAFIGCTSLVSFNLTGGPGHLSTIEDGKALVRNNTELVVYPSASGSITLNNITTIGEAAFANCTGLTSASFPQVTTIHRYAFSTGTSALTIILGPTAPTLGYYIFGDGNINRITVTVKVPAGATGYGTIPATYSNDTSYTETWGNGFRGSGWDGSRFTLMNSSSSSSRVTLYVEYQ